MGRFTITPGDALRGKPIKPGWYPAEIIKVEDKSAKDQQSMNTWIHWKIIAGEYKGFEPRRVFSEKAPGFLIDFLEALGAKLNKDVNTEVDVGENLVGKKQQIYIENGEYNGRTTNEVSGFRPLAGDFQRL